MGSSNDQRAIVADLVRTLSFRAVLYSRMLAMRLALHDTDLLAVMAVHELTEQSDDDRGLGPTVGQLRERLELSSPATSALLDRLERAGHLERIPDAQDRRRVRLHATPQSHDAVEPLLRAYLQRLGAALARFDGSELAAAERVLRAAIDAMDDG